MGKAPQRLILAPKENGGTAIIPPQQIFGVVQFGVREKFRARHFPAIRNMAHAFLADDAANIPQQIPKRGAMLDRPCVEIAIVLQRD